MPWGRCLEARFSDTDSACPWRYFCCHEWDGRLHLPPKIWSAQRHDFSLAFPLLCMSVCTKGAAVLVPVSFPKSCSGHQAEGERELESLLAQFSHPVPRKADLYCRQTEED